MQDYEKQKTQAGKDKLKLAASFAHPLIFARIFFAEHMDFEPPPHHAEFLSALNPHETGQRINILAPRGSAKSTYMAVIYPLWRIYFKDVFEMMDMPTGNFIVIVSRSETMAIARVFDIKTKIETHTDLQWLINKQSWGVKGLITSNNIKIWPRGRGAQIRGAVYGKDRPFIVIADDIDDSEACMNPNVREKDQLWFDTDFMRCGRIDGKTNFINIDTVKHEKAISNLLRERPGWKTIFLRAIEHPADLWHPEFEHLWQEWEKLYTDMNLEAPERNAKADAFYKEHETEMMKGVVELWPEVLPYLYVRKEICDVGYYPVLRELQNSTHDPDRALFDMKNAVYFTKQPNGFLRTDKVFVEFKEMTGATVFLDWAGGKDIVDNCYACAVAVVWVKLPGNRNDTLNSMMDGTHGYVYAAKMQRTSVDNQIKMCLDLMEQITNEIPNSNFTIKFGVEGFVQDTWNAQKRVIQHAYKTQREDRKLIKFPTMEFLQRTRNKHDRIDTLQPIIRNGWLMFDKGLDREFMDQMDLYPTGDFLDGPDALEGACQIRVSRHSYESKQRKEASARRNKNFKVRMGRPY